MADRNQFKYRCADCGWTGYFQLNEFARACRPRCSECGCQMLDPTHDEARRRIRSHDAECYKAKERRHARYQEGNPAKGVE